MSWSETRYSYIFVVDSRGTAEECMVADMHKVTITPVPRAQ